MPSDILPLELLNTGDWADIAEVSGEPGWVNRLGELGLRCGNRLRVLQAGSPCMLQIGDTRLSFRSDWTLQVLVRPVVACA